MKLPPFFRRRSVLLPTLPGLLLILLILGAIGVFAFRNLAIFLAVSEPVDARYLVIEGWLGKHELKQSLEVFIEKRYQHAFVSGVPIKDSFNTGFSSLADRGYDYLLSIGFPEEKLTAVPAPDTVRNRTYVSAVAIRDRLASQNLAVEALDVFSGNVHARRSRYLYQLAFGEPVRIGIIAASPEKFELETWWRSSDVVKSVSTEAIGWFWVICCADPASAD
jgi:hypothetical protein